MYLTKCSLTLILFAFILNINAEDSKKLKGAPPGTSTPTPITDTSAVNTESTITVPVTPTTVNGSDSTTTDTPKTSSTIPQTSSTVVTTSATGTPVTPARVTTTSPNTTEAPHRNRQFDGPSFIGGIVLATGLMAIGFVAFKFYKARTERNYHTL